MYEPLTYHRYNLCYQKIAGGRILDIGSGGKSPLRFTCRFVIQLDINRKGEIDIIASATHLLFKDNSFDTVVLVDVIEHLPQKDREVAVREAIRVCKSRVIIHTPLNDDYNFIARKMDLRFQD